MSIKLAFWCRCRTWADLHKVGSAFDIDSSDAELRNALENVDKATTSCAVIPVEWLLKLV